MITDIEKSLKSRIKNLAIEKNISPIVLWQIAETEKKTRDRVYR